MRFIIVRLGNFYNLGKRKVQQPGFFKSLNFIKPIIFYSLNRTNPAYCLVFLTGCTRFLVVLYFFIQSKMKLRNLSTFLCMVALGGEIIISSSSLVKAQSSPPLPYWDMPFLDPFINPFGGASMLSNFTSWTRLYLATPELGTYAMSPMISFLNGYFLGSWKLSPQDEDQPGQKIMWSMSTDGINWTPTDGTNVLFPPMNSTQSPRIALFAEPSIYINGHVYAAASPIQFCLYPDQYQDRLLLRRVYGMGNFGPIFWASNSIPSGFEEASAMHNVTTLLQQDNTTQQDIGSYLTPDSTNLPCPDISIANGTKCEACTGACQPWTVALNISSLENERSHYRVPSSTIEMLLYRSHNRTLFASTRDKVGNNWTVPIATNITDTVANFNAGNLPNNMGAYLVSNAMINIIRDPLFFSTTIDGYAFTKTAVLGTCENSTIFANPPTQPWGCLYRYNGGAKEGGLQYVQCTLVTNPTNMEGFYCIMSQNKEDIWVSKTPLNDVLDMVQNRP